MAGIFLCVFLGGFVLFVIFMFIVVKKDEKLKAEYRKQHVVKHTITDTYFAELNCEWDKKENKLVCDKISKMFGKYTPKLIIEKYDEKKDAYYLDLLKTVYEHQEDIVHKFFVGLQGMLDCDGLDEENKDEIKAHFHINHISIRERGEYFLEEEQLLDNYVDGIKLSDESFPYGDVGEEISPDALVLEVVSSLDSENITRSIKHIIGSLCMYMDCETKSMCYVVSE